MHRVKSLKLSNIVLRLVKLLKLQWNTILSFFSLQQNGKTSKFSAGSATSDSVLNGTGEFQDENLQVHIEEKIEERKTEEKEQISNVSSQY